MVNGILERILFAWKWRTEQTNVKKRDVQNLAINTVNNDHWRTGAPYVLRAKPSGWVFQRFPLMIHDMERIPCVATSLEWGYGKGIVPKMAWGQVCTEAQLIHVDPDICHVGPCLWDWHQRSKSIWNHPGVCVCEPLWEVSVHPRLLAICWSILHCHVFMVKVEDLWTLVFRMFCR